MTAEIASELNEAEAAAHATGRAARVFKDFMWSTLDSWSAERRVVAKAEWTHGEANPRFIVTSRKAEHVSIVTSGLLSHSAGAQFFMLFR